MFSYRELSIVGVCVLSVSLCSAWGQSSALLKVQEQLTKAPSVTLHIDELHLSRLPHAELKVKDGVPRSGLLNFKLDSDEIARTNTTLAVRGVKSSSDKSGDVIHIILATPSGASATLAFQFGKGALATLSEEALEQALSPVLTPTAGWSAGSQTSSTSAALSVPVRAPASAPPPVKRSTILDLPPAAPDLPPMHASSPALDGCWYEPFYSPSLGVEAAYQQCEPNNSGHVSVSENGTTVFATTSDGQKWPLFTLYAKQPTEALQAAVKRAIIMKFRDPASRSACVATASQDPATDKPIVSISATGPYAKRKAYALSKDGSACDGYTANEDVSTAFWEFPSEDRLRFIEVRSTKSDAQVREETIHFRPSSAGSATSPAPSKTSSRDHEAVGSKAKEKIPPMHDVWTSQGRVPGVDLADEAATALSFTHGMMMISGYGDAFLSIACQKRGAGAPALMLIASIPGYQNQQTHLANNIGELVVGQSRRNQQVATSPAKDGLNVFAPLTAQDASEMSANEFVTSRKLSLSYFSGAGQDIAAGNLPPANEALDSVLNACGIPTPARTVAEPEHSLSPDEVKQLSLAKLKIGSTVAEAKVSLGTGFHYLETPNTTNKAVSYLLASSATDQYGMTLIDGKLRAFSYAKSFPAGSQPLAVNLIRDVTAKTWKPLSGTSVRSAEWSSTASGVPIDLAHEQGLPNCRVLQSTSLGQAPQGFSPIVVRALDVGPACGVTFKLDIATGDDQAIAKSMTLLVADDLALHDLGAGIMQQKQQDRDDQRRRANQQASPF